VHLFDGLGDRIWTLQEASEALDYDEAYLRERAEQGLIPSFRVSDELMFSKAELESWILSLGDKTQDSDVEV
jgi:hypothetical protein